MKLKEFILEYTKKSNFDYLNKDKLLIFFDTFIYNEAYEDDLNSLKNDFLKSKNKIINTLYIDNYIEAINFLHKNDITLTKSISLANENNMLDTALDSIKLANLLLKDRASEEFKFFVISLLIDYQNKKIL